MTTKIVSWNVNGVRAIIKKDFVKKVENMNPDILCLQETKAHEDQVDKILDNFSYHFWNGADKKGYSGTATFSKIKPLSMHKGMNIKEFDTEGRILTLEFKEFWLVNVYIPNSQHGLLRLAYKRKWNAAFLKYLKNLEKTKPVLFCGDINVAHTEKDIARPKDNVNNPGFTLEEREDHTRLLSSGFVDIWRENHPEEIKYTWWSYRFNVREKNIGWRIDAFIASKKLMSKITKSEIHNEVHGSDHCPVSIEINL